MVLEWENNFHRSWTRQSFCRWFSWKTRGNWHRCMTRDLKNSPFFSSGLRTHNMVDRDRCLKKSLWKYLYQRQVHFDISVMDVTKVHLPHFVTYPFQSLCLVCSQIFSGQTWQMGKEWHGMARCTMWCRSPVHVLQNQANRKGIIELLPLQIAMMWHHGIMTLKHSERHNGMFWYHHLSI